jgi:hypothetical protein
MASEDGVWQEAFTALDLANVIQLNGERIGTESTTATQIEWK